MAIRRATGPDQAAPEIRGPPPARPRAPTACQRRLRAQAPSAARQKVDRGSRRVAAYRPAWPCPTADQWGVGPPWSAAACRGLPPRRASTGRRHRRRRRGSGAWSPAGRGILRPAPPRPGHQPSARPDCVAIPGAVELDADVPTVPPSPGPDCNDSVRRRPICLEVAVT